MRKILLTNKYGAGWSTWMAGWVPPEFSCTYPPLIEAVERGDLLSKDHPAIKSFLEECIQRFPEAEGYLYVEGCVNLCVEEVPEDVLIQVMEYDGLEYLMRTDSDGWW